MQIWGENDKNEAIIKTENLLKVPKICNLHFGQSCFRRDLKWAKI